MIGLIIVIHLIICILLMIIVLIQSGRGGGLVESFSGVESMFGTKTNAFLTRTTSVLAVLFFITCLSLAILSARQSKSLMRNLKPASMPADSLPPVTAPENIKPAENPKPQTPAQDTSKADVPKAQ